MGGLSLSTEFLVDSEFYLAAVPVFILAVGSILAMLQSISDKWAKPTLTMALLLASLGSALFANVVLNQGEKEILGGAILTGGITLMAQTVILSLAIIISLIMYETAPKDRFFRPEISSLFQMLILGMYTFVSSNDLITVFIGLELSSIGLYAIVGYTQPSQASIEGALKYFILGAFAAAFLLFGFGLLYAGTQTLNLSEMTRLIPDRSIYPWIQVGALLALTGLLFKLAIVPFHAWAPDVYEAAPTGITAFMATSVKVMIMTLLIRLTTGLVAVDLWIPFLTVVAILSMTIGNIMALVQTSLKRTLAYSSIAHSGYLTIALTAAAGDESVQSILFYLFGYILTSLIAFGSLMWLESKTHNNLQLDDISGLAKKHPWASFAIATAMFSFAGMPPTVGFLTKFFVFYSAIGENFYGLVIVAALTSTISLFYYLRIIVKMYMVPRAATAAPLAPSRSPLTLGIVGACVSAVLLFGTLLPGRALSVIKSTISHLTH